MVPDPREEHALREILLENQRLLIENNQLLHKLRRSSVWAFWWRLISFALLIGAPFVLYYFVIEPYFISLGSSFETFRAGLHEIPGWKQFYDAAQGGE